MLLPRQARSSILEVGQMKTKALLHILTSALLSFSMAFAGIGCFATAFQLDIPFAALALCCAVFGLAGCIAFTSRGRSFLSLCILALLAIYLLRQTQLKDQIIALCYHVSRLYDSAYGCGWLGRPIEVASVALPLYCWGGLNGLIGGLCVSRGRATAIVVFFSLLPLALCLVLTNTIPGLPCLFLFLLSLILLLLTQNVRRRDAAQGAKLTWMLLAPVLFGLVLLLMSNPQATYNKQHYADDLGDAVLRVVDRLPYVDINADGTVQFDLVRHIPDFVDLRHRSPGSQLPIPVMEVSAESNAPLYLRGRDYDSYSGTRWEASARDETFTSLHSNRFLGNGIEPQAMGKLTIKISGSRSSRYLPYYPETNFPLQDGACRNPSSVTTYSYDWYTLPSNYVVTQWASSQDGHFLSSSFSSQEGIPIDGAVIYTIAAPHTAYLQLPDSTRSWAECYLQEQLPLNIGKTDVATLANAIADLVRRSAEYDLNTPRMPEAYDDLARWFLEESDTGYCVHYATATTVLLRAAGIPARYVEGYVTEAKAGQTVTVTEKNAHAWAEYFVLGFGWIPLESTAADLVSGILEPVASSEVTEPSDTSAPTVTEAPTEPSGNSTDPSKVTDDSTSTTPSRPNPSATDPQAPSQVTPNKEVTFTVPGEIWIGLGILLLLFAQRPIRLRCREKYLSAGTPNKRALKHWRFSCRLAKLSHTVPPAQLEELALRAKFSQHTLVEEDLMPFDLFRAETVDQLKNCPWWAKLYHRFLWAIY